MKMKVIKAHLALFGAGCMLGLMSPMGKLAMDSGMTSMSLATMRIVGAAICFWIVSLFMPRERVSKRDLLLLFFAGLLGILFNQGLFIIGLSLTTPIEATIITTSLPIITMILAALFLKEPASAMKITGVVIGVTGALILILSSNSASGMSGNILGNILCLIAQISFACYLTIFKGLISRYRVVTLMKWMFLFASLCFLPFSFNELADMAASNFPLRVWLEAGYVVLFGTFFAYLLILIGQRLLRPTIVSMYNYLQPVVGSIVTVLLGIGTFGWTKAFASALIFIGVYVVTRSRARDPKS